MQDWMQRRLPWMPLNWKRDWNSVLNIPVIRILSVGKMRRLCLRIRVKEHLSCQNKAGKDEPDNVAVEYIQYNKDKNALWFQGKTLFVAYSGKGNTA